MSRWLGRGRGRYLALAGLAALLAVVPLIVSGSHSGDAAFPGGNGRIAFVYGNNYSYSNSGIWTANPDGGSAQMLSAGNGDSSPAFSLEGTRIAFGRAGGIAVMNADGSGATTLLPGGSNQVSQREWRENFIDPSSGKTIPVVMVQSYTQEWHNFTQPAFSPDGTQIAVSESAGKRINSSICAVTAPGSQECIDYAEPGWYFHYEYQCLGCGSHLVAVSSANGAPVAQLTAPSDQRYDTEPTWGTNGKLAFTRRKSGGSSIYEIVTPGAGPGRLTSGYADRSPDFSPDGSQVVFSHGGDGIGLVAAAGGAVTLIPVPTSEEGEGYMSSPVFSPSGSRIAFHRTVYGPHGKGESGLFTVGLDGSGLARVAESGFDPSWQPLPAPQPAKRARIRKHKGKVRLDRKGRGVVGTVVCGSSRCSLKVVSSKLSTGGKPCSAKTAVARKVRPAKKTKIRVKVTGKCLGALRRAGHGRLVTRIRATDALGRRVLALKATLVPGKAGKRGH
jgi:Tol biopolymer transport system component